MKKQIKMLEENEQVRRAMLALIPPNGSAIMNTPELARYQTERERKVAELTIGEDVWDITLVQSGGDMQRIYNYNQMALHYSKRMRYTRDELDWMHKIGVDVDNLPE